MTVVPLQNNGGQVVPLQKQEPIKPMVTPEEAKALSAAAQAKLNNADWMAKYREMTKNVTPRVDPVSMQSQMAAALRDPVYGQATATGLAAGEGMLNSWIAGINSRARRDESDLSNERWIKAMDDLAKDREENKRRWEAEAAEGKRRFGILQKAAEEDRKLRRAELAESKKRYLPGVPELEDSFLSPEDQKKLDVWNKKLSQGRVYNDPVAYEQALDNQRRDAENRQKFLDSRRRNLNITGEALDAAGATKGMTKEQAMDKYGVQRHDKSWLPKWMGGTTEFEDSVSNLFKENYGDPRFNRMTPIQLINRFQSTGNERGANKIRALIGNLVKEGNRIDEIVGGVRPEDPVYVRIGGQTYILEPNTMSLKDVSLR